jgi:prephenate dehydrogenase
MRIIAAGPEEHDSQAALRQGLTHRLANAVSSFDHLAPIRTRNFDLLVSALAIARADSPEI